MGLFRRSGRARRVRMGTPNIGLIGKIRAASTKPRAAPTSERPFPANEGPNGPVRGLGGALQSRPPRRSLRGVVVRSQNLLLRRRRRGRRSTCSKGLGVSDGRLLICAHGDSGGQLGGVNSCCNRGLGCPGSPHETRVDPPSVPLFPALTRPDSPVVAGGSGLAGGPGKALWRGRSTRVATLDLLNGGRGSHLPWKLLRR